jgi:hypothetical protein
MTVATTNHLTVELMFRQEVNLTSKNRERR